MFENKPRKPWLAGFLTFFTIGLGHIYAGKAQKGIILYFSQALITIPLIILLIKNPNIISLTVGLIFALGFFLFCLIDSIKTARLNKRHYSLKKYNKWYIYLFIYIIANLIVQTTVSHSIKENIIQAYKIPSGAMLPTLFIGDHILVDKHIYKTHNPKRGDIIVFKYPKDTSIDYVKRLVATGGDVVEIRGRKLLINNIEQHEEYAKYLNQISHNPKLSLRNDFGPITVPENSFFVLGDNRDNSSDSRHWGFVNRDNVKGKVTSIYWSWDIRYPILSYERWRSIRWNRIGISLE